MESLFAKAVEARKDWIATANTDSYRLFHGIAEGMPGLNIDRYGPEVVAQVFRDSLNEDWGKLAACVYESLSAISALSVVRRGQDKEVLASIGELQARVQCQENGLLFWNSLRRAGSDPWFYLDFRAARRFIATVSKGARVANFFAYTGTAGVVAAAAGAKEASNIDFGKWCSEVSLDNCELNQIKARTIQDDFFSVARQWAGGATKNRRRGRKTPVYAPESFDVVILDPPTRSKGPNGAVDILRDYPSLAKPCIQMIAPDGWLVCSHHHTGIGFDDWQAIVRRTAEKAGRSIVHEQRIAPDPDFPIVGEEPLLKVLAIQFS
jgi:23S rRNA (cytosine1962-C5)-methyltransferase